MALLGIGVLVFFIHHIATAIQASTIIASITKETLAAIDARFPAGAEDCKLDHEDPTAKIGAALPHQCVVRSGERGYVQDVEARRIVEFAAKHAATVRVDVAPGAFVAQEGRLLTIFGSAACDDQDLNFFRDRISIRAFRTIDQEFGFGIRQLVDIALKALSPGINDTTTAVMCIDHLGAIAERLAGRPMPARHRSADGVVRLILRGWSFDDAIGTAFDQIRNNASGNVAVIGHLLGAIAVAAEGTDDAHRRDTLKLHLGLVAALIRDTVATEHDRERLRNRFDEASAVFTEPRQTQGMTT
ncbi:MAG: DUF2254 family protein [Betaproteobacteria bacterium]